jgi:tetratricopeptide (TPR) repeat protein
LQGENIRLTLISIGDALISAFLASLLVISLLFFFALMFGVRDITTIKMSLETISQIMTSLLNIVFVLFIFIIVAIVILWLVKKRDIVIMPFEIGRSIEQYSGRAISDLLVTELLDIKQIHSVSYIGIRPIVPETLVLSLVPASEIRVAELGTISLGSASLSISHLLIFLKQIFPGSNPERIITGSLQLYGSAINIIAKMETKKIRAWQVLQRNEQIPYLVKDLAFKIVRDLCFEQDVQPKTWRALKHYTEALKDYHQYTLTEESEILDQSKENCLLAISAELGYEKPFDLLYNLGLAYFSRNRYKESAELFDEFTGFKKDIKAFYLAGDSYKKLNDEGKSTKSFENAIKQDPRDAIEWNIKGLAFYELERYEEAIGCFDKALEIDRELDYIWNNKALVFNKLGDSKDNDEKGKCYNEAIKCNEEAKKINRNRSR